MPTLLRYITKKTTDSPWDDAVVAQTKAAEIKIHNVGGHKSCFQRIPTLCRFYQWTCSQLRLQSDSFCKLLNAAHSESTWLNKISKFCHPILENTTATEVDKVVDQNGCNSATQLLVR